MSTCYLSFYSSMFWSEKRYLKQDIKYWKISNKINIETPKKGQKHGTQSSQDNPIRLYNMKQDLKATRTIKK